MTFGVRHTYAIGISKSSCNTFGHTVKYSTDTIFYIPPAGLCVSRMRHPSSPHGLNILRRYARICIRGHLPVTMFLTVYDISKVTSCHERRFRTAAVNALLECRTHDSVAYHTFATRRLSGIICMTIHHHDHELVVRSNACAVGYR